MKKVVIFGSGGHAHVVADIVFAKGDLVIAFLDDNIEQSDSAGPISDYKKYQDCEFIIGIGDADTRQRISLLGLSWYTAIHPSSVVSPTAEIGEGSVIMPNSVINARSVIGNHCIVNSGAIVEHDNIIGDYSHVSVGAKLGGNVVVGEKCWIGIGATVINNISIISNTFIGAGSVVVKNIDKPGTYYGVPAKKRIE